MQAKSGQPLAVAHLASDPFMKMMGRIVHLRREFPAII